MAESKPGPAQAPPEFVTYKEENAPNLIERAKEETGAVLHTDKTHHDHKETHGLRNDIDEKTPLDDVKAPNMFERAKEEFEAIIEAIHPKKESPTDESKRDSKKQEKADSLPENHAKTSNLIEKAKQKIETLMHHEKSPKNHDNETPEKSPKHHTKETHGRSDDIDESIPIDHVKAPDVFERVKEEIEAIVEAIHPKKEEKTSVSTPKKEGGFGT